jgi:hypothetical protein
VKRLPRELLERLARVEEQLAPTNPDAAFVARMERMTPTEMARECERAAGDAWGPSAAADLLAATAEHVRRGDFPPGSLELVREALRAEAEERGWDWRPPPAEGRPVPVPEESR